jgi:predicted metal-binding membrane protein
MLMRGDWTHSMMWMRMPGETWAGAAASFVAMWIAMMVPMMLPSVAPVLWRHRAAAASMNARHPGVLTATVAATYFAVWAVAGAAAFALGASVMTTIMEHEALARAVPFAVAATVGLAGAVQLTPWKSRPLACCNWGPRHRCAEKIGVAGASSAGIRLGVRCVACCANLMAIPLVLGVMDVRAMFATAAAIAVERLAPGGERVARLTGLLLLAAGSRLAARAAGI